MLNIVGSEQLNYCQHHIFCLLGMLNIVGSEQIPSGAVLSIGLLGMLNIVGSDTYPRRAKCAATRGVLVHPILLTT